ncbi:MAG: MATE family efflux transporter [Clostridia bacterium]|nr:MATE family efflux transporter [Clostridia bacterium]
MFNAADLAVLNWRYGAAGELMVGAVGNASTVAWLIIYMFMGFSVGTSVSVAHAIGAKKEEEVSRTVHTAIPTAFLIGLLIAVAGIILTEPLLRMINTPADVLGYSATYMRIYFVGTIFMMVYNVCSAVLRAVGDTKTPLMFLMMSGVLNVVLNLIFVTVFGMNIDGVALATAISQGVSAILVLVVLSRRTDSCKLRFRKLRIHRKPLGKILYIGIPSGLQNSLFSISSVVIQSAINPFGSVLMSGNAAAGNIEGFMHVILNSFMQAAVTFVGQNTGAKNYKRVKKIFWTCLGCVVVVGIVICVAVYLSGPVLLSIYADTEEAIGWGMMRLAYICSTYILCGMMEVTTGALRGIGAAIIPMFTSVLGVCGIRVAWIYTVFQIPEFHTPQCLYVSFPISWGVTFLVQGIAFYMVYKKKIKQEKAV